MKATIYTALAVGLIVLFLFYRRRLKLALLVVGGGYAVSILVRFFLLREEVDRFAALGLALAILGLAWAVTNLLTSLLQRRRERRARR